ncbi:MAG TPA: hypothetical protein H9834_00650 [Candidatus Barnesiella excrementavium]|nr:hypothetical protein [Candidatus Barnesiella excrementavium]
MEKVQSRSPAGQKEQGKGNNQSCPPDIDETLFNQQLDSLYRKDRESFESYKQSV